MVEHGAVVVALSGVEHCEMWLRQRVYSPQFLKLTKTKIKPSTEDISMR